MKRFLAIVLVLVLAVSLMPASALADDGIYLNVGGKEFTKIDQTIDIGGGKATLTWRSGTVPRLRLENVNLTSFYKLGTSDDGIACYAGIVYAGNYRLDIYCLDCTITVPSHNSKSLYDGIYAEGNICLMGNLTIKNADIGIEGVEVQSSESYVDGLNMSISTTTGPAIMADTIRLEKGGCYIESTALCAIVCNSFSNYGVTTINHFPDCTKNGYGSVITVAADSYVAFANKASINMTADLSGYKGNEYLVCSGVMAERVSIGHNFSCNMNVKGAPATIVNGICTGNLYCEGTGEVKCHLNLSGNHTEAAGISCEDYNKNATSPCAPHIESIITGAYQEDTAFYVQNASKITASEIYASVDCAGGAAIQLNPGSGTVYGPDWKTPLNMFTPSEGRFEWIPYSPCDILTVTNPDGSFANVVVLSSKGYPFRDIDNTNTAPYKDAILWAVDNGITNGFTPVEFRPNADCTRGQVVTFLWRAKGCPEPTITENPFVDVATTSPFYKAILWAYENGITTGFDETHFKPSNPCTRAQVVTFLWRAEGKPAPASEENPFVDVSSTGKTAPYYTAILWAAENGITSGYGNNDFRPNVTCTRGQIVTFIYRDIK